ncbi:acetaldehyde dehydrogenase (acetylating) [Vagococcus fluvialis]|uniref:Acetaldehyde dehydrogenase (Acetylating) n=1 Tax=Vagococcus fluvialis TaxID=2738 RepID=A0A7X6DAP1_9ENTE|nr:acetaldehyde dehydrogenase (acetylating) [Vagococcus fluvialis]NKC68837.1 acetaldehyde dehydrogenase (acetylating) [Vagococcus fluvialis]
MVKLDKDLCSIQEARNLAESGKKAANELADFSNEQIDKILKNMRDAIEKQALSLAKWAVKETGFGKVEDKAYKNHAASTLLYEEIKDQKTIGIIDEDKVKGTLDVAESVGLVLGIVPSTNPTSTVIFKAMIAIKSRNAICFAPHPTAAECTKMAADILNRAAIEAGAPENVISCVSTPTMASTNELLHSPHISLIIATGGPGMVKAAYSSGKPAIGVGAGNSPAYIESTADIKQAVATIIASKTFDNGTICASEQSIVCERKNELEVIKEFEAQGGYFMTEDETNRVCDLLFKAGNAMNAKFVGRDAHVIAEAAGITIPKETKVLLGRQGGVGAGYPLSFEKLTTVLAFYVVEDWEEACHLSIDLLQNGIGHTMSIHTNNRDIVLKFAAKPASRILVNTGGSQGGTGISTGLPISFTLGCGTSGGSSVSDNVSPKNLLNIKKVAYGLKDVTTLVEDDKSFQIGSHELVKEKSCLAQKNSCPSESIDMEELTKVVRNVLMGMKD